MQEPSIFVLRIYHTTVYRSNVIRVLTVTRFLLDCEVTWCTCPWISCETLTVLCHWWRLSPTGSKQWRKRKYTRNQQLSTRSFRVHADPPITLWCSRHFIPQVLSCTAYTQWRIQLVVLVTTFDGVMMTAYGHGYMRNAKVFPSQSCTHVHTHISWKHHAIQHTSTNVT